MLSASLQAQPWYQIEVILFSQDFPALIAEGTTEESWPTEVELNWQEPLLPLFESERQLSPTMRKLPINSRTMNGDAYAFRVTEGYRLLWHQAWQQPLVDEQDAPWILVEGGEDYEGRYELEGSLRIHLSRFLHMTANFWLTEFGPQPAIDAEGMETASFSFNDLPEKPELYNACTYLRFQPETPPEAPVDILAEQPIYESWWTAPYECDSPRSRLNQGMPRYAPMLPVDPPLMQQITYISASSEEPVEILVPMPELSIMELPERESERQSVRSEPDFADQNEVLEEELEAVKEAQPIQQIIQIDMNRRLRSEEYHFVDHPKLGMLIRILEVDTPLIEQPDLAELSE